MKIYTFNNLYLGTANKKFVKNAIKELKTYCPDIKVIDRFPEGVFSFALGIHREVFFYNLINNPPVFLRHVQPIDRMFFIPMEAFPPEVTSKALTSISQKIGAGRKVSVQARRVSGEYDYTLYSFKNCIDPILREEHRAIPTVKNPDQIISIFATDSTEIDYTKSATCSLEDCSSDMAGAWQGVCFMGISTPRENICEWTGGQVRFVKEEKQKSRAEFKLLEAFEIFDITPEEGGLGLDLGSSPGGWARILCQKGYQVTAVDRAPLDPDVMALDGIRFIKRDAVHFRDEDNRYDIITNDINRDPLQSAQVLVAVSPCLKKGKPFIMTIKLTGNNPEKTVDKVKSRLQETFDIKMVRQLFHNREEVTLWGLKK